MHVGLLLQLHGTQACLATLPHPLPPKQPPTSNPKQKPLPRRPNPEPPKPCKQNEHKTCRNIFRNILVLEESQWFPGVPDLGSDYSRCCRLSGDRYFEPVLTQVKCLFTLQELILSWWWTHSRFWDAKMGSRLANLRSQEASQRAILKVNWQFPARSCTGPPRRLPREQF